MEHEVNKQESYADYLPDKFAVFRAMVSAIPYAGGALDHLLFDKADSIRSKNLSISFEALSNRLKKIEERLIDIDWFKSEEALAVIKVLNDKISFEPDRKKIQTLGELVAVYGLKENVPDKHKLQILDYIGNLSSSQIELLKIIKSVPIREQKISRGGLVGTFSGKWMTDIVVYINNNNSKLLSTYATDIEILESRNTIRRLQIMLSKSDICYKITELGKLAAKYIHMASE